MMRENCNCQHGRSSLCVRLLICVLLVVVMGCSDGGSVGTVRGEVTLDGQPLPKGHVEFIPIDGQAQTAGAMIVDGKFQAQIPVSKMRVKLHATKPSGKKYKAYDTPDTPWEDEMMEALPAKYNEKSDLQLEVKRGTQPVKYDLKSK